MDLSKISNKNVRQAIEALQANDKKAWYSYFTEDAIFTDDGRTLNFRSFFDNAFDKKEKFLDIGKIENEGKDIYGNFYAGQWGTFRVFFKFHQDADGKFDRLDIGQTSK
ncbi:MAG: nuclear transport factor 2 family protein [Chitinophagaceae bacterium]|nr:nuclear transport factor 2 family protein [Chitinophagaceae bacterium]MCW5928139.1 nuclear transport factor 2 family protein [Chitinophagaceae bacterium]